MLEDEDKHEDQHEEEQVSQDTEESSGSETSVEASDKKPDDGDDLADYSESVKKRINKLTYKTREAERREQEALEYAKAVKAELDSIKKRELTLSRSFESEAEIRLKTQEQLFKDQLRVANDQGDVDKQVELQTSLVQIAAEKERLRNYRLTRQREEESAASAPPPPPQQVQRQVPDKKAQEWAERNSWFGSDRVMTSAAYAIHEELVSEGVNPVGDLYYKELDKRMREEFPHKFAPKPKTNVASARPSQVKKSSADAELTDTQKNIARRLGVSYDDYKRQLKLVQERPQ